MVLKVVINLGRSLVLAASEIACNLEKVLFFCSSSAKLSKRTPSLTVAEITTKAPIATVAPRARPAIFNPINIPANTGGSDNRTKKGSFKLSNCTARTTNAKKIKIIAIKMRP